MGHLSSRLVVLHCTGDHVSVDKVSMRSSLWDICLLLRPHLLQLHQLPGLLQAPVRPQTLSGAEVWALTRSGALLQQHSEQDGDLLSQSDVTMSET